MNLSQLVVLVAIVDTGSLTEAAEAVGLTQSAVSYSLSKLESELGVTLLERGRQGIAVTQIGDEVLQIARSILSQVEIIRQKTAHERGLSIGKLRVGCVPTIPARLLTGMLHDFQQKYPDIEIVLFEGTLQELIDWLASDIIDIGTVLLPQTYVLSVPLAHSELVCIVSAQHPSSKESAIPVGSLRHETLIGPRSEYITVNSLPAFEQIALPHLRHEISARTTIFAMVRENMGISLIPAMLIESGTEGVVPLSLTPRLYVDVYLVARTASPAAEAFLTNAHIWAKGHGFLQDEA